MADPLAALAQAGAIGAVLAAVLGLVLSLFKRLIERLMQHLDATTQTLREIRDEMRGAKAEMEAGRIAAKNEILEELRKPRVRRG